LQANEQRKIEMLGQVSVAMNHELNNVASIIELQLRLLARQQKAADSPAMEKPLREIHQSLKRITGTVQSLKNVRRIVLTEYLPGTKMLDLEKSTRERDDADEDTAPIGLRSTPGTPVPQVRPKLAIELHRPAVPTEKAATAGSATGA
jgi:signal transduction histidine kinase